MKTQMRTAKCAAIAAFCAAANLTFAQWQFGFTLGQPFGRPNPNIMGGVRAFGIGSFPNGTFPSSALDINTNAPFPTNTFFNAGEVFSTDCPAGFDTYWRLFRNNTEQGMLFSRAVGGNVIDRNNFSIQASQNDITFHTRPLIGFIGRERMRVVGVFRPLYSSNTITTYPVRPGNVGIGNQSPVAMLQVGRTNITNFGGYRNWMDVGTLYTFGSDNMYIGYKSNTGDAVINWGNNPANTNPCLLPGGGFLLRGV